MAIKKLLVELNKNKVTLITLTLTFVIACSTIASFLLWNSTQEQIKEAHALNQGSFVLDLNRDFFFNDRLYKIRKAIDANTPLLVKNGGDFTESDIDDYIGTFEMMYLLNERGILDKGLIDDNFGGFIADAYLNEEIRNYVDTLRENNNDNDIYVGFYKWGKEFSLEN